ncbi:AraC family transcriptional regulator [Paenibacillus dendritiformis]|uniref:helix-turn-helix domain-containing protein n=1 Tax=Paenibacillus dendritiformis TaxID=130049 RepID=UPI00105A4088|nr:AraC family transcriptional regulator [Paenibacillus dendritiformis]TDL53814.1 AraC family transcriptional regulator [Paenibacillus dendritiformis]
MYREPVSASESKRPGKIEFGPPVVLNQFEQPLSIPQLAKTVGLSATKLKKSFRELFGVTIFDLVREQRLRKGAWLLETNQMKVCEAAIAVGYSNPSNFTSTFRKQYGCNPSEFLQQLKQHKKWIFSPQECDFSRWAV